MSYWDHAGIYRGFRGAGKTLIAAVISILTLAGIRLPIAYIASQYRLPIPFAEVVFGVRGIWIAFFISNVAGALIAWVWFRRGTWRDGDVRAQSDPDSAERDDEFEVPAANDWPPSDHPHRYEDSVRPPDVASTSGSSVAFSRSTREFVFVAKTLHLLVCFV